MLNMFQITAFREHAQKFLLISYDDHDILRKSEVEK
jgi:hypothetical protein